MPKQWENHRSEIESLYCTQNKPLHEVASYMLNKHGFAASTRSYRTHIREWGLKRRYKSRSNHRKGSATSTSSVETTTSSIDDNSDGEPSSGDETVQQPKHEPGVDSAMFDLETQRNLQMLAQLNTDLRLEPIPADTTSSSKSPAATDIGQAVFATFAPLVERVMNRGSPIGISENWEETSPLSRAIRLGFDDLAALLLSYGADPDARVGCYGRTALHQAVFYGRLSTVQTVLDHGASVSLPDAGALTPLHQATNKLKNSSAVADVVKLLVCRGADVNARDGFGRSPFCHLLQIPRDTHFRFPCDLYVELVYLFLQKGAETTPKPGSSSDRNTSFKIFLDALIKYTSVSSSSSSFSASSSTSTTAMTLTMDDGSSSSNSTSTSTWPYENSPLCQTLTLFLRRGADIDAVPSTETGETLLAFLLRQDTISEQIASAVRLLCVHVDARERSRRNGGGSPGDQRQILGLMASSAFWSRGLLDGQITAAAATAAAATTTTTGPALKPIKAS